MKKLFAVALGVLFLLGSLLRLWNYWYFPVGGETQDEVAWSLLGSSLVQTGKPVSWSYFAGYEKFGELRASDDAVFPLVAPVLDHPPLFALLPGMTLTLLGEAWNVIPSLKVVRLPVVLLSVVNLALFFYWQKRRKITENEKVVALILFATLPAVVFLSRMVVAENLLVTGLLAGMILQTFQKGNWRRWAWFLLLALFPMTKVAGIPLALGFVTSFWVHRAQKENKKLWLWALAGLSMGVFSWFVFSASYDWGLFIQVQTQQAQRDTGLLTLLSSQIMSMVLVEKVFVDPWLFISWASACIWFSQKRMDQESQSISLIFLAQVAFLFLSVGEHTVHGWYRIPLWPLFTVMIAQWFTRIGKDASWFSFTWLWLILGALVRLCLFPVLGSQIYEWQALLGKIWLSFAGFFVFCGVASISKETEMRTWKGIVITSLILLIVLHTAIIVNIKHKDYWQDALYWEQGIRS